MKGRIGRSTYLISLFPKKISNKIKDRRIPKQVKVRLKWIEYYHKRQNISKTCRYFGISRTTFYKWYNSLSVNYPLKETHIINSQL